jgi:hypothetical protein
MTTRTLLMALAVATLVVKSAAAQTHFAAELHPVPEAHDHGGAGGHATFILSNDQKELHYSIVLLGLDFEPDVANRIDPEDVFGIHMHLIVPGQIGPHVLNIFGDPAEEDADLVVDYEAETLTGRFDVSDATRDPLTGELVPQFFPLTTKVIDDWIDYLMADGLYLAVHTVGQGGAALLHGDINQVPEPSGATIALLGTVAAIAKWRRRVAARSRDLHNSSTN